MCIMVRRNVFNQEKRTHMKKCLNCKIEKDLSDFYTRYSRNGKASTYCKDCIKNNAVERQRAFKLECIKYKGGKCINCGFDKHPSALQFHHRDPSKKDFSIAKCNLTSWEKNKNIITVELDKCDLLCSNCHAIIHSKY